MTLHAKRGLILERSIVQCSHCSTDRSGGFSVCVLSVCQQVHNDVSTAVTHVVFDKQIGFVHLLTYQAHGSISSA